MRSSRIRRWLGRLASWWTERRILQRELAQAKREAKAEEREQTRVARMWASSNLVAEMRRHNDLMAELVDLAREVLAANSSDAGGRDNAPVSVDEAATPEEVAQYLADAELARLERGEAANPDAGGIDRVDD